LRCGHVVVMGLAKRRIWTCDFDSDIVLKMHSMVRCKLQHRTIQTKTFAIDRIRGNDIPLRRRWTRWPTRPEETIGRA
jgi:hypothetical protein